ncbi:YciI family protein [Gilliamella sp. Bif1-4]|jgi:uncharacterized protein YciI|uniref:YciI family protein n=1 Tax=Gilliamella sp. Bif1-4 TaxID=3120233 RepID=UPI00080E6749|nr:YciI family protein [Gilliamella apicola]OCG41698.1 GTP cyclohydrolase [Gilliamella apicola]
MFVYTLTYVKPINEVEKHYESGYFIASGRKVPHTGGVILCRAENKEQAIVIMQEDPFYIYHIAQYEIIKFVPSKYTEGFENFI